MMKFIKLREAQKVCRGAQGSCRGSASLFSLFIALVVLTIAVGFNWIVKEHLKASLSLKEKIEGFVEAHSHFQLLLFTLLPGQLTTKEILPYRGKDYLGVERLPLNGEWVWLKREDIGVGTRRPVRVSMQDTNGLLSLVNLDPLVFSNLLKILQVSEERRRVIVDSLIDWVDRDDYVRLNGAEAEYYRKEGKNYRPRNYAIQYLEELKLIRGMDEALFQRIAPYLTLLPNTGLNPNTSKKEVVQAYLGLEDEKVLENLMNFLKREAIHNELQLFQLTGRLIHFPEGAYFFPSGYCVVRILVGPEEKPLYTIETGVSLRHKIYFPYEIFYWIER